VADSIADSIAITGASGFVGRHIVAAAAAQGLDVIGLYRQPAGEAVIREAGGRPIQVHGLHPDVLARAFKGCAAVVHLAQIGSERPEATYEMVNVTGTRHVLEAAHRAGVPVCAYLSGLGVAHYGMTRRCTNRYFLSKLQSELELFKSDLRVAIFRPSYILGPGGELVSRLLRQMAEGEVEMVGDGAFRMQPLSVLDAADALVKAVTQEGPRHAVYDFVGPERVTYLELLDHLAFLAAAAGRPASFEIKAVSVEAADAQAANGGYQGMAPDSLDCFLCDETSDHSPLERLLGRPLRSLDDALESAMA
jgi:nucleoside-diphosphate-sugar epimerase